MSPQTHPETTVRVAKPEDAAICGAICHRAFAAINARHNFPCDFPGPEVTTGLLSWLISEPGVYCVVAEAGGRIVGSNAIDERAVIHGVGPITVDPDVQNSSVGRKLMQAVIDRAHTKSAAGIRLVQAGFHNRSLALYTSLGFDVREPLSCLQGKTIERSMPGCSVRMARLNDLEACNALAQRLHGFDRSLELKAAMELGTAIVVERGGHVTGCATQLAFSGHSIAETNIDLQALIGSVESFGGPGILVPTRNSGLYRWCLKNGLRIVQPMTLMSMGLYNEPAGAWLPSILF